MHGSDGCDGSTVRLRHIGLNPGTGRYENSNQFAAALQYTNTPVASVPATVSMFIDQARRSLRARRKGRKPDTILARKVDALRRRGVNEGGDEVGAAFRD